MSLRVKNVAWKDAKHTLSKLREQVYVYGWRIPADREFDQQDNDAFHVLMSDNEQRPIATARLTTTGELGRVAVKPKFRGEPVYKALYGALLDIAREKNIKEVTIQCDLNGVDVFKQHGFKPVGNVFMDAGIPRQKMVCPVDKFRIDRVELTH